MGSLSTVKGLLVPRTLRSIQLDCAVGTLCVFLSLRGATEMSVASLFLQPRKAARRKVLHPPYESDAVSDLNGQVVAASKAVQRMNFKTCSLLPQGKQQSL